MGTSAIGDTAGPEVVLAASALVDRGSAPIVPSGRVLLSVLGFGVATGVAAVFTSGVAVLRGAGGVRGGAGSCFGSAGFGVCGPALAASSCALGAGVARPLLPVWRAA